MRRRRVILCGLLLFGALLHLACGLAPVKVADIQKEPSKFEQKTVTLHGTASGGTKLPFMKDGFYQLDDGSGSITVITKGSLPAEGKKIFLRGKVRSAFQIAGKSFGLVIEEDSK